MKMLFDSLLLCIVPIAICLVLILLPPKYDPAIRWKERNERNRK